MTQHSMPHQVELLNAGEEAAQRTTGKHVGRVARLVLRGLLLLLVLFLAYKVVRVGLYAYSAYQGGQELLALRGRGGFVTADLARAQAGLATVTEAYSGIDRELAFFYPALRAVDGLPWIGATLAAVPNAMTTGRAALALGQGALAALAAEADREQRRSPVELALDALRNRPDDFVALAVHAQTMQTALEGIQAAQLVGPLVEPVSQAQAGIPLMRVGLELAPVLPRMLGFGAPQRYLLLVQNNQELRATGGFISAVGTITVHNGRPADLNLTDSYNITRNDVDHPAAPDPMRRYMGIELIFLRDANWSPDFPTTAQLARSLYAQDAGEQVNGVVSIDLRAVELLITALGPIQVPGEEEPVTGANLVRRLQEFWDRPPGTEENIDSNFKEWWKQRKDFMPLIAKAALQRIEDGAYNPLALAAAVRQALDERAVQIWMDDPVVARQLAAQRWNGALFPDAGADYLALVDTNMGYNKVDAVITRAMDYQVRWTQGAGAPAEAILAVTYRHPARAPGVECIAKSEYGQTYTDMIERCYFNYVRLYVPAGSELVSITGVTEDSVVSRPGERGTQVFAGYFVLQPGYQHTVTFTYRLPPGLTPGTYRLVAQRQSGVGPVVLRARIGGASRELVLDRAYQTWTPPLVDVLPVP